MVIPSQPHPAVLAKFAKPEIGKVGWGGWHSGESARLPPMWPGFDFWSRRHMWAEFVFYPAVRFFTSPQKPTFDLT